MFESEVGGGNTAWLELALLLQSLRDDVEAETHREGAPAHEGDPADLHDAAVPPALHHEEDLATADAALTAALDESLGTLTSCKASIEQQTGLQTEVASWHDDVVDVTGALNAHIAEVRSGFAALDSDLNGSRHSLRAQHVETRTTIDGIARETQDRHTSETQTAFQHLIDALDSRCQRPLDDTFRELDDHATQIFEHAEQDAHAHSSGLESVFTRLMLESAGRITHDTLEELRRAFAELLRHGIELMAEEAAAQAISMTVGASTTTALSPILPELAAARTALHAINSIVSFFTGRR